MDESKIFEAISVLKEAEITALSHGDVVEICYSGGKDSDVILRLAQMAGIRHEAIYKATTIDPAGTIKHARMAGASVILPQKNFFKLIEEHGFPTRRARFCCAILKEYKIKDVAVVGVRKCESSARAKRYTEPSFCRMYSKTDHVEMFAPILDWTDTDIEEFIAHEKIQCHPLYYDSNNNFDVKRRLGCLCCPLQSHKKLIKSFEDNPRMVQAWIKHGVRWFDSHPTAKSHMKFGTIYNLFFHNVFCESYNDYILKIHGLFGELDCKKFIEDRFDIRLE